MELPALTLAAGLSLLNPDPPLADCAFLPPPQVTRYNWSAAVRYHREVSGGLDEARLYFASEVPDWEARERRAKLILDLWTWADDAWGTQYAVGEVRDDPTPEAVARRRQCLGWL